MLVAAAVCPHPPLIVPEVAGEAAPELDGLREACVSAVRSLAAARPDALITVGGAGATRSYGPDAAGSLAPWGADVRVGDGTPVLPLSLTLGRWLLGLAGAGLPASHEAVASDAPPEACARLGETLAGRGERVALLVMGDGSARLTVKSPGYLHPDAAAYDEALARALAGVDVRALAALDPGEADELWVAGRAAFQVLAGAAGDDAVPGLAGELLYDEAPYGVGYLVARWLSR
ncbi:class III extradiol dioxygenase subunit B-like domain-containing protein [Sphaerisporangium sp. NPDC051017]|uniref:class III extradiol dioxygenase subunit B-like domain-containing protein n=1 Tax=Sphaerisporangium sp. NPDC051017 TaxID=3154636 RepID=UPI0034391CE1